MIGLSRVGICILTLLHNLFCHGPSKPNKCSPTLAVNSFIFQLKKGTFNSITASFGPNLAYMWTHMHVTCNCSYCIHVLSVGYLSTESKLYIVQRLAWFFSKVLHFTLFKLCIRVQTTLLKVLVSLFCTHGLLNKSTKMPFFLHWYRVLVYSFFKVSRNKTRNTELCQQLQKETTDKGVFVWKIYCPKYCCQSGFKGDVQLNAKRILFPSPTSPPLHAEIFTTARWQGR